ncbi:MAG: ABC transporter permease [Saprospiraceae bacterium]|nr:MAG: ABC transporter permease [Saprospiraceae bacterium]
MLLHNVKITLRHLLKNKTATFINFAGLTIGLTASLLICLYVLNEWQTDRALPHPERTYRLLRVAEINNEPYEIGITSGPFAPALQQDFSAEIESTVRVVDGNSVVALGEYRFQEDKYYYADPNFLTFFDLPLLHGHAETALSQLHSIVLSRKTALRYFDNEAEAMGQTIRIDNSYDATVTGVLDDLPGPMHFDFDLVESTLELEKSSWWTGWWNNNLMTYVRLKPDAAVTKIQPYLSGFMDKYFGKDFERTGSRIDLRLQPIQSVYFEGETRYDPVRHGDWPSVRIFLFAAILLIVIACANYVNMASAKAVERGKEVGIQKVLGSGRLRIVWQMLAESFLMTSASVFAAVSLVGWLLPRFEQYFDLTLDVVIPNTQLVPALVGLTILVSLIAGLYPGWFLSSFKPAFTLKGSTTAGERHTSGLRKALIVFQFVLSIGLLCSTIFVHQQLNFLKNKNLGFDKSQVLLMDINSQELYDARETFREQLKREPGVREVAFMNGIPGGNHDATSVDIPELNLKIRMRTAFADFDFAKTLGLQFVAGRDFNPQLASDSTRAAILNERAVADLGLTPEEALGKKIILSSFDTISRTVVGVVKDYNFSSLHDAIEPLVISTAFWGGVIAVKAQGDRISKVIAAAETAWNAESPAFPFSYQFLDERLDRLYKSEAREGRIFALFAIIAIFIACLGMFGLASFAATTRIKEIGIRKVLGASIGSIISLLSADFLKLVGIAFIIASPLVWYFMKVWLQNFAYSIEIEWWVFVLAGMAAMLIAGLTVSARSIRAALVNPVESLRNE